MSLTRRSLLLAGAALPLTGAAGIPSGPAGPSGNTPAAGPDWKALAAAIDGPVSLPGTTAYERDRLLVDPRFDAVRPPAVVSCAHAGDVAEVIRFARRSRVPVITRGGGHSYTGDSTSATGLVLDLRRLEAITYDGSSRTATVGGGATLMAIYNTLGARGVSVPSGSCGTVGVGGITLGGGIGLAASAYGLTCDAVTAADLVTADGRHRTVDRSREPDLFWALRGGGGGQFGVVTGWRLRTHPVTSTGTFVLTWPWSDAARVAAGWQARLATAPDETWSACQFASDGNGTLSVRVSGSVLDGPADAEAAAIIRAVGRDPLKARLDRRPHLDVVHDRAGCTSPAGCSARATELAGSDIFRRPLPAAAVAALLSTVERRSRQRRPAVAKLKRMTGAVGRIAVDATAFPWRGAHTMLQWLVDLPTPDPAATRAAYTWIDAGHRTMSAWSAGRYLNYLEPDPAVVPRYHGPHLTRLRRIRATADPDRLFRSPYAL